MDRDVGHVAKRLKLTETSPTSRSQGTEGESSSALDKAGQDVHTSWKDSDSDASATEALTTQLLIGQFSHGFDTRYHIKDANLRIPRSGVTINDVQVFPVALRQDSATFVMVKMFIRPDRAFHRERAIMRHLRRSMPPTEGFGRFLCHLRDDFEQVSVTIDDKRYESSILVIEPKCDFDLASRHPESFKSKLRVLYAICCTLRQLHQTKHPWADRDAAYAGAKLSHNDIKPNNLGFLNDTGFIFDFGLSRYAYPSSGTKFDCSRYMLTPQYRAPEVENPNGTFDGQASDVFALSVTEYEMMEMMSQDLPHIEEGEQDRDHDWSMFADCDAQGRRCGEHEAQYDAETLKQRRRYHLDVLEQSRRQMAIWAKTPPKGKEREQDMYDLVRLGTDPDPATRITMPAVCVHRAFDPVRGDEDLQPARRLEA